MQLQTKDSAISMPIMNKTSDMRMKRDDPNAKVKKGCANGLMTDNQ
jgi:hypothetical protein